MLALENLHFLGMFCSPKNFVRSAEISRETSVSHRLSGNPHHRTFITAPQHATTKPHGQDTRVVCITRFCSAIANVHVVTSTLYIVIVRDIDSPVYSKRLNELNHWKAQKKKFFYYATIARSLDFVLQSFIAAFQHVENNGENSELQSERAKLSSFADKVCFRNLERNISLDS